MISSGYLYFNWHANHSPYIGFIDGCNSQYTPNTTHPIAKTHGKVREFNKGPKNDRHHFRHLTRTKNIIFWINGCAWNNNWNSLIYPYNISPYLMGPSCWETPATSWSATRPILVNIGGGGHKRISDSSYPHTIEYQPPPRPRARSTASMLPSPPLSLSLSRTHGPSYELCRTTQRPKLPRQ